MDRHRQAAFIKYIEQGKGGWIGFHHATLLGEFDGFQMWPWFHQFMGGIRFKNYIATFVTGTVTVEDKNHPAMKGIASPFVIENEEWYTYDTSPRPNVHVLASVDEKTYTPGTDLKMGDHPVIWTNEHVQGQEHLHFHGPPSGTLRQSSRSRRFSGIPFSGPLASRRIAKNEASHCFLEKVKLAGSGISLVTWDSRQSVRELLLLLLFWSWRPSRKNPAFKVLAFYSTDVEPDHVHTANDALAFYRDAGGKK